VNKEFGIPSLTGKPVSIKVSPERPLVVLGANGVGKSTLIHYLQAQCPGAKRIPALRLISMQKDSADMSRSQRRQLEKQATNYDQQELSRFVDQNPMARMSMTIGSFLEAEGLRSRVISNAVFANDDDELDRQKNLEMPLSSVNRIFHQCGLNINFSIDKDGLLRAANCNSPAFDIAELSDGERNTLYLISEVVALPKDGLILIDEPERHIHRSISVPLIQAVMDLRSDCSFVLSTHEPELVDAFSNPTVVLVREYQRPNRWQFDVVEEFEEINDEYFSSLWGERKLILFVEGVGTSLDNQIYSILFPHTSIRACGNCLEVERAVRGINEADRIHWINAVGLIDGDNRTTEQRDTLQSRGIFTTNCYSVEGIYYHPDTISMVAERYCPIVSLDPKNAVDQLSEKMVEEFRRNVAPLAAARAKHAVRELALREAHKEFNDQGHNTQLIIDRQEVVDCELDRINRLVDAKDLEALTARYPLKKLSLRPIVARELGFTNFKKYEASVRNYCSFDKQMQEKVKALVGVISDHI
jgi:ABC-type cobalamin/Fe3+-siderophores transport system ATPase subunit